MAIIFLKKKQGVDKTAEKLDPSYALLGKM